MSSNTNTTLLLQETTSIRNDEIKQQEQRKLFPTYLYVGFRKIKPFVLLFPPFGIQFVILLFYYFWLRHHALSYYQQNRVTGLIELFFAHLLIVLLLWSLLKTTFTRSLNPDDVDMWLDQNENISVEEQRRMITMNHTFPRCHRCGKLKPPRCHHCTTCDKCILKMDHHCVWLGNCIGLHNYKYFLLFLFYGTITCLFVVVTLFPHLKTIETVSLTTMFWICGAIAFSLSILLAIHLFLVSRNMTTLEFVARMSNYLNQEQPPDWDKGCFLNWIEVFGDHPNIDWLLPLSPPRRHALNFHFDNTTSTKIEQLI